jgi:glucose/arabinose dehydrogenase
MTRYCIFLGLFLLPTTVFAQETPKAAPDHGRVLACCMDVFPHKLKDTTNIADTKNYVFRGKVISLGKDKRVSICYDTEHMRVAGAWVGKPMVFSADKNMGPSVEGEMLFATKPGPGWADPRASRVSGGSVWDDPRDGKEGPLPRDWARYKGLYLHGEKVVLSYSVGDMDVLEMPTVEQNENATLITRTLRVAPTKNDHAVLICDIPNEKSVEIASAFGLKGALVKVTEGKESLLVLAFGEQEGGFKVEGRRLFAVIPASKFHGTFEYSIAKLSATQDVKAVFQFFIKRKAATPAVYTKGGPPRWTQTLETTGTLGDAKSPYTLDQIGIPEQNPWNASIRFAGLDFFPDGRAALCTWDGDVWIVSGLQDKGGKLQWKRFAAGLQQPLGLKIIKGVIHTAGRDQITKLHDLNNDGEADFYENLNNEPGLTLQRHEFVMDLETDKADNIYFCRSGHYIQSKRGDNCLIYKMSPDGTKLEKFAKGFREPNGISISTDGVMTVADNEGNGVPQTPIYRLLAGKDYGFVPSKSGNVNQGTFKLMEQPIVWLGPKVDTSAGGQVWVPVANASGSSAKSWGPLAGGLLHTSYGNCALFHVMIDKTAEPWQGAVWKFPLAFNSGIMRARFNPADGQLYVCGLRGWGTSGVKDGQFARIRYTGNNLPIPLSYRVVKNGIEFGFSAALDKAAAEDDENWAGTWTGILKKTPSAKETQDMPITSIRLADDRKTLTIVVDKMRPVPNFALQYRIKSADGASVAGELNGTIHRVP